SLKLKDIPSSINYLPSKKIKLNGMDGFYHVVNTNSIAYLRMYFDMNVIAFEDLPYVFLLRSLLKNVKTTNYSAIQLNKLIKTYLGDLAFGHSVTSLGKDDCKAYFKVIASSLLENVEYIPHILNEVLLHSKFSTKEVLTVVKQITNNLKQGLIENGMGLAMIMSKRHYSLSSALVSNFYGGPTVYNFFNNLVKNYNHQAVSKKLKEICVKLFNKKNVKVSLSGDENTIKELSNAVRKIKLPLKKHQELLQIKKDDIKDEALIIPSGVSYNALSNNLECFNLKYNGKYAVLSQIINYDYLWSEVRVKGGAYGCSLSIAQNGDVSFGSYRDPNVVNTYKVFENVTDYLKNFKVSKEQFVSYIIGTMSGFDMPSSTPTLINEWDLNYLLNITKKDKINLKKQIISTKQSDIVDCYEMFEEMLKSSSKYTIGNEVKVKEQKFDDIKVL
ncbi:MAG: hypothetical protein IKT40_07555, partial [Bacilli bacterium]|nr:hypothetical protein [Bacilli bacterium]